MTDFECTFCKKNTARYKTCSNCFVSCYCSIAYDAWMNVVQVVKHFLCLLKVKIQLITWDVDEAGKKVVRDIKEQDIFFADVPVMADLYEEDGRFKLRQFGNIS